MQLGDVAIELDDGGSGEPVLLLHGFPTARKLWRDVSPALIEAGFRAIAPDLVGYGESRAGAREPDMASQAGWMIELLDTLGIDRAHIVAHDVGTAAAQILTARAPRRVRSLVLIDGVHESEWAMGPLADIIAWDPAQAARLHRLLVRRVRTGGSEPRLDEAAVREVMAAYEGDEGGRKLIRAARALDPRQTAEIGPALRASGVPALVIWGERDPFLPVDAVARPLAGLLSAELIVLPGGHFLPLDRGAEVAAAIGKFLTARSAAPR